MAGKVKNECTVDIVLPNRPTNQFKLVQQSRQQALRAYCTNIYTVVKGAQAVVILAMTANGKLLPPFLVLKVSSLIQLTKTTALKL